MKVQTVCVLGGSGFVGHALVAQLANSGRKVRVLTRYRERCRELGVQSDVELCQLDSFDKPTLTASFRGCDAVINLVGILNEDGSQRFTALHAQLPATVAAACVEAEVPRLLQMSALNADAASGASDYLRSKGQGEDAAHAAAEHGVAVTSFRPSVIFGVGDSFFGRFATLLKLAPVLPLACPNARFQPVYVEDVAAAFVAALDDPRSFGQRLDLGGPRTYTLKELVEYIAGVMGLKRLVIGLPDGLSRLQAALFEKLPGKPFTMDNYRSLQVDSVVSGSDGFALFGITPYSVEAIVPRAMKGRTARRDYDGFRYLAGR